MKLSDDTDILAITLCTLFGAYGKEDQSERLEIYYRALFEFDANMVHLACQKCLYTSIFLPSIAEIINEIKNIELARHPENRLKSWDEAVAEIIANIKKASPTITITWSTEEISQAVKTYGFSNLCNCSDASFSFALEFIKKNYISICERIKSDTLDRGLLKMEGGNILGIPNHKLHKINYNSNAPILTSDIIEKINLNRKEGEP